MFSTQQKELSSVTVKQHLSRIFFLTA